MFLSAFSSRSEGFTFWSQLWSLVLGPGPGRVLGPGPSPAPRLVLVLDSDPDRSESLPSVDFAFSIVEDFVVVLAVSIEHLIVMIIF